MSGLETEPFRHRSGACDVNTFVAHADLSKKKQGGRGRQTYYPSQGTSKDLWNVRIGEIVYHKRHANREDSRLLGATTLQGEGADEVEQYGNDPAMIKAGIQSRIDIVGVAATEANHATDAPDQGFVTAVAGVATVDILDDDLRNKFLPGKWVRASLPDPNYDDDSQRSRSGRPLNKYQLHPTPEDPSVVGDTFLTHLRAYSKNPRQWMKGLRESPRGDVDAWKAACHATSDSALMNGLLMVYVLMRMGYLEGRQPDGKGHEYPLGDAFLQAPDITCSDITNPEEFCVTLAALLDLPDSLPSVNAPQAEKAFFKKVRSIITNTQFYDGTYPAFEFGQGTAGLATAGRMQDGRVNTRSPRGAFIHNQLNHFRRDVSAKLHAIDEWTRFRLGKVVSGPMRKKRVDIVLGGHLG